MLDKNTFLLYRDYNRIASEKIIGTKKGVYICQ